LAPYKNIQFVNDYSFNFAIHDNNRYDMVFVDGDHKRVIDDFVFWSKLNIGGLLLFHDYSPAGSARECIPVYKAVRLLTNILDREPDTSLIDNQLVGMAGFYKRENDVISLVDDKIKEIVSRGKKHSSSTQTYLETLYRLASRIGVSGDMVECGVQNGGSAYVLAEGYQKKKQIHLFDSLVGNAKPTFEDSSKAFAKYNAGDWCLSSYNPLLLLPEAKLHVGWFDETLLASNIDAVGLLHVDTNLYLPTRYALERFLPHMLKGSVCIVSAYGYWSGVKQAVDELVGHKEVNKTEVGVWWIN
jgi:predicted O-methyltransferase YrrM